MNAEAINKIADESAAEIRAEVKRRVVEAFSNDIAYIVREQINAVTREFVDKEILPELSTYLTTNKGPIMQAARASADKLAGSLETTINEHINATMKDSWKRQAVLKALFGS